MYLLPDPQLSFFLLHQAKCWGGFFVKCFSQCFELSRLLIDNYAFKCLLGITGFPALPLFIDVILACGRVLVTAARRSSPAKAGMSYKIRELSCAIFNTRVIHDVVSNWVLGMLLGIYTLCLKKRRLGVVSGRPSWLSARLWIWLRL